MTTTPIAARIRHQTAGPSLATVLVAGVTGLAWPADAMSAPHDPCASLVLCARSSNQGLAIDEQVTIRKVQMAHDYVALTAARADYENHSGIDRR